MSIAYPPTVVMPELPEVETTRRGLEKLLAGRSFEKVVVHQRRLRWPIPPHFETHLTSSAMQRVERRGKYLLFRHTRGTAILHLGMSGSLRVEPSLTPRRPHDHIELFLSLGQVVRFHDPRRFGSAHWTWDEPLHHPLLSALGPEPLSAEFDGEHLARKLKGRTASIKQLLLNSSIVAGVGNIYANEALFKAGIHPRRRGGAISLRRYETLARQVKEVLSFAIAHGGTTLRDYLGAAGAPGSFREQLLVYEREEKKCKICGTIIKRIVQGQRSTFYCPSCQR